MFPYFVWIYIDQFLSLILIHLFCLHLHQFQEFWKLYCPIAVDIHLQIVDDYNYDAMCTMQKTIQANRNFEEHANQSGIKCGVSS